MDPPIRILVPEEYKIYGHIHVDRLLERKKHVVDPLLGLIKPWQQNEYTSTTWTRNAYKKIFEKFSYAEPPESIREVDPELWDFASSVMLDEYSYMEKCVILSPLQTEKNMESTPAFPKFLKYATEADYVAENGWKEYIDVWNAETRGIPLWWVFLKNETLKVKKIKEDDIRMIMCTDPVFTRIGAAFDQHQNTLMKEKTETRQAQVGWSPFYGGLNKRLMRLQGAEARYFVEMDWTRYDGTIPEELFRHVKEMRWFLHDSAYKTPENRKRYEWYVENLINKLALLPTGEVTRIEKGNPSGQISTTTDNNFVNTFLTAYEVGFFYKQTHGRVPSVREYRDNVDSICYGDDRILAINESFCIYDESQLPTLYKERFGMWVKPENIKVSSRLEGLSFCGLTFTKVKGVYYGIPNVNKILSTLEHPNKKLPSLESLWGKLQSLRILVEYADQEVKDYLEEQIARVEDYAKAEKIELPEVPDYFYVNIWQGGPK
ncbi:RdRp [Passerine astrovirus 3]|nr:RdRp [Passerine astrovirus 3]